MAWSAFAARIHRALQQTSGKEAESPPARRSSKKVADIQLLPAHIWLRIFSFLALNPVKTLDPFPSFENRCEDTVKDRHALCHLSLTCRFFRDIAQESLYRHALPLLTRIKPELYGYNQDRQFKLYQTLLFSHPLLRNTVSSIAFDLRLDVDLGGLIASLPNLQNLELYGTPLRLASTGQNQLAAVLLQHQRLTHIKVTLPIDGGTLQDALFACIPRQFAGHLSIDNIDLRRSVLQGDTPPSNGIFSHLTYLYISPYRGSFCKEGLVHLIGTDAGQKLERFALERAHISDGRQLDPVVYAFGDSLLELVLIDEYIERQGPLRIEGFTQLRRLAISGTSLLSKESSTRGAGTLASRLPQTIEDLHVANPYIDFYRSTLDILLPRLPHLRRLEIAQDSTLGSSRKLAKHIIMQERRGLDEDSLPGRVEILRYAGELDEACKERNILTLPRSFRQSLLAELAWMTRS